MKQLTFIRPGRLEWWEVPGPRIEAPTDVLVRPVAVARCDLDAAIVRGAAPFRGAALHFLRNALPEAVGQRRIFRNAPFKGPFPVGHEGVAEVVEVGDAVRSFAPGAKVIVPFQISCGSCARCREGQTHNCSTVPPRSMYGLGEVGGLGWGGFFSDRVRVPFADHMLQAVPAGTAPESLASASDNIPDGYRTVGPHLAQRPGASVLVVGGGAPSVGLYAAAIAVALGAAVVDYLDDDPQRRSVAVKVGASAHPRSGWRGRQRYPITVDASADPEGLGRALLSTEPGGVCTSVGIYSTRTTPIPLLAMYGIGLTFITGRVHASAAIPDVLRLVQSGRLDAAKITTRTARWDEAPEALLDPSAKVVITAP